MPPSGVTALLQERGWKNTGLRSTMRVSGCCVSAWSRETHDQQPRQSQSIPNIQKRTIGVLDFPKRAVTCVVHRARQTSNVLPSDRQTAASGR